MNLKEHSVKPSNYRIVKRTDVKAFGSDQEQLESEIENLLTKQSESNRHLSRIPRAVKQNKRIAKSKAEKGKTNSG